MPIVNSGYNKQFNNPAKYSNVLHIEEYQKYQSDEGHWIEDWITSDLGTTNAQIRNIRGNEFILAGANQVKVSARINIRYRKDIEDNYYELGERLRFNIKSKNRPDRIFEIEYMNNLEEQNIELEFLVNEVR